jgi:hypothetical protein
MDKDTNEFKETSGTKPDFMRRNLSNFIEKAFCVTGSVNLGIDSKVITKDGKCLTSITFEVNDSERGLFYVTLSFGA